VTSSLTTVVVLVTILHVGAFAVIIMIRLRRDEAHGAVVESLKVSSCALCPEPSTHVGYDGLDPDERRDPYTGRLYSADATHYQPLCAAH
jgi:hypothetical protein